MAPKTQLILINQRISWDQRKYVQIATNNPQFLKNSIAANVLNKSSLGGEYVYVATVVAAHSENGQFFEGQTLVSDDRLEFKFTEEYVTAYKVNEPLNDIHSKVTSIALQSRPV